MFLSLILNSAPFIYLFVCLFACLFCFVLFVHCVQALLLSALEVPENDIVADYHASEHLGGSEKCTADLKVCVSVMYECNKYDCVHTCVCVCVYVAIDHLNTIFPFPSRNSACWMKKCGEVRILS